MNDLQLLDIIAGALYSTKETQMNSYNLGKYVVENNIEGDIIERTYPFYLIEYEWHYNHRNDNNQFISFLKNAMFQEKELLYWKAESKEQVTKVAYD